MARHKVAQIEARVLEVNRLLDAKEGSLLVLDRSYGGMRLQQECGPGLRNISPRLTASEMWTYLNAMMAALDLYITMEH